MQTKYQTQRDLRMAAIAMARDVLRETDGDFDAAMVAVWQCHEDCLLYYPEKDREARAAGIVRFAEYQLGILR